MKKLLATLILSSIFFSACSLEDFSFFTKEANEAIYNLSNEAIRIKEGVETKVDQVQSAADSVRKASEALNDASDAVQSVTEDIKDLTGSSDE